MFSKKQAVARRRINFITDHLSTILFMKNTDDKYKVIENFFDHVEKNVSEDFKIKSKIAADDFVNRFIVQNYKDVLVNSLRSSNVTINIRELKITENEDAALFLYQNLINRSSYINSEHGGEFYSRYYTEKVCSTISEMIYYFNEDCELSNSIFSFFLNSDNIETKKDYEHRYYTELKIILDSIKNKLFDTDKIMKDDNCLKISHKIYLIDNFSDQEDWFLSRLNSVKRGDGFSTKKASIIRSAIANHVLENSIAENCAKLTKSNKREIADELYHSFRRKKMSEDMSNFVSSLITNDNTSIFSSRLLSVLDKKTVAFLLPKLTQDFKHDYWMTRRLKEIIES